MHSCALQNNPRRPTRTFKKAATSKVLTANLQPDSLPFSIRSRAAASRTSHLRNTRPAACSKADKSAGRYYSRTKSPQSMTLCTTLSARNYNAC
eukprot:632277-Pyramimonas_sp.AAC.1